MQTTFESANIHLGILKEKLVDEINEEFAAHNLVAVHVPNVLEIWLKLTLITRLEVNRVK